MPKKKCIVLFSGGLDSRLAVKIMQKQCNVIAVYCKLPFSKNIEKEVKEFCKKEKIKLKIFDCTKGNLLKDYLKIIKKPKFGTGAGMNPCIDCRIFILKLANTLPSMSRGKGTSKNEIEFIATGEVKGQRPMSQMKKSMDLIEEKSKLNRRLIRPLSDKSFGYNIQGRRRDKQIALAKKFKISYPTPAGGCLLCEKLYCEKLKKIINKKNFNYNDIKLLKIGRHFESSNIILGRDEKENKLLEKGKATKIIPTQPGPSALVKDKKYIKKAKELIQKYSKHKIKEFIVK